MTVNMNELFERLNQQIAQARENGRFARPPQVEVEGVSTDELVRVRLSAGKVAGVDIDVRATRTRSNVELGELVAEAIDAALLANAEAVAAAMQDTETDFGSLQSKLSEIGADAQRNMERYASGMNDAIAKANQAAQTAAEVRRES